MSVGGSGSDRLPFNVCHYAASIFAGEETGYRPKGFGHDDMSDFFCGELRKYPDELPIPCDINRTNKFKWWLNQFDSAGAQRRVLEKLCRERQKHRSGYQWPSEEERQKLLQMLGSSPIEMPDMPFDISHIRESWDKAIERVSTDPEGAITAAKTLLEGVCKHILDELGTTYTNRDELTRLYALATEKMNIAPNQHVGQPLKKILGSAHVIVDGLANFRNLVGDAHGKGKNSVKPLPRHAEFAVNMAGGVAMFLLSTFEADERSG